jgi:hypothetical protein
MFKALEAIHIYPWEIVCVAVFVAVLVYFKRERKQKEDKKAAPAAPTRREPKVEDAPEVKYRKLRLAALETTPEDRGLTAEPGKPFGALMEIGMSSVVTLICFADGDASLYYASGGGMIGGSAHENVRKSAQWFVALARKALPKMTRTDAFPAPEPDMVRFYVLTPQGVFTTETDRESLADPASELSTLYFSGQEVVTQMREVQELKAKPA